MRSQNDSVVSIVLRVLRGLRAPLTSAAPVEKSLAASEVPKLIDIRELLKARVITERQHDRVSCLLGLERGERYMNSEQPSAKSVRLIAALLERIEALEKRMSAPGEESGASSSSTGH